MPEAKKISEIEELWYAILTCSSLASVEQLMAAHDAKVLASGRPQIMQSTIDDTFLAVRKVFDERLKEKGAGAFVSSHEVLGSIMEEFIEYTEAIHINSESDAEAELYDIIVAAVFGLACMRQKALHW